MPAAFTTSSPTAGVCVVQFPEHVLGGSQAVELSTILRTRIGEGDAHIVFNLGPVEVMNSTGLGMLVASHTTLRQAAVPLTLTCVPSTVGSLLDMTQLRQLFTVCDSIEEAVQTS